MKHACKIPCKSCPFLKTSIPGYLGGVYKNGKELHDLIVTAEKNFSCHTVQADNDVSYDLVGTKEYPYCAGALMYMRKACKMPRDKELNQLVQAVDKSQLVNILSVPELIKHHEHSLGYIG